MTGRFPDVDGASPSTERQEAAYQQRVRRDLRRNYVAHLCHGLLGQTGFRLLNAPTFLPAYLFQLTGSELAVGIARSVQALGMFLSPILGATFIEHRRRVLPVGLAVGACMRLCVLGIALAGFLLPVQWSVPAICLLLMLFGFSMVVDDHDSNGEDAAQHQGRLREGTARKSRAYRRLGCSELR